MPKPASPALGLLLAAVLAASLLAGCGGGANASARPGGADQAAPVLLGAEDTLVLQTSAGLGGPLIAGSIQPRLRADLRSELAAVVTAVLKENGEAVRRGDLLVRLDDAALRDALLSAQEAERSALQGFDQAERQLQRLGTLRASGMVSTQALEDAEVRRNTAQSDLAAARARSAQARQQLQRTEVRAPFDGLVSERKVSVGDTAQVGKELVKVIDPRELRFEGLVSADAIASVRPGQTVSFRVNGFAGRDFTGQVRLVSPTAHPVTRQVEVLVDLPAGAPARLAGLYAEGRVQTDSEPVLVLPGSAVVREGDRTWVWRLEGQALRKVAVTLGERDPRRGEHPVRDGLAAGQRVLRHPVGTLKDGQPFQEAAAAAASAALPRQP